MCSEDDYDEKSVSVLLEGEEAELVFVDHPRAEISVSVWRNLVIDCCDAEELAVANNTLLC